MERGITLLVEPALLILISLADEPKHGYAIMQDIESLAGWSMRAGTLYGALGRMDRRGWIEEIQTEDYRRRPYALTSAGYAELARQLPILSSLTRTALNRTKHQNVKRRRAHS
jgi:DNA-binding PadR family transcriptional regulator